MPTYEFQCRNCSHEFSLMQSMAEHARGSARCPKCSSDQLIQKVSSFMAQTSKKS